jgi:hypothetical protein
MLARTRDRLEALEAKIAPKAKAFVFISLDAEPGAPSREDRLAAFKGTLSARSSSVARARRPWRRRLASFRKALENERSERPPEKHDHGERGSQDRATPCSADPPCSRRTQAGGLGPPGASARMARQRPFAFGPFGPPGALATHAGLGDRHLLRARADLLVAPNVRVRRVSLGRAGSWTKPVPQAVPA